jgi:hypothetical protein
MAKSYSLFKPKETELYGKDVLDYTPSEYEKNQNTTDYAVPLWRTPYYPTNNVCARCLNTDCVCNKQVSSVQTDQYISGVLATATTTLPLTKAVKYDEGKLRYDLIQQEGMEGLA